MTPLRLALIGFGNVGRGLARILRRRRDHLGELFGDVPRIVAVCDAIKGSVHDPEGLDPGDLLDADDREGSLEGLDVSHRGWDAARTIDGTGADVVIELTPTDLETGRPALDHVTRALRAGKHVVTTNKGPIALRYRELDELARAHGVVLGFEGTVLSGTPALHLGRDLLAAAELRRVEGILNGTTNYVLTRMEAGSTYDEALARARRQGYAEADPTADVEGFDAAGKAVILANLLLGSPLGLQDVERQGITDLTREDVVAAREDGERWKLIARIEAAPDGAAEVTASVCPVRLPEEHPLAGVSGATNAITYTTGLLGPVTLVGPGAGRLETGYAVILDLLGIERRGRGAP